ncbi:uncharacterized protein N7515_008760 [Penicillium bovifimosum]|uniref:Uncharacterized protein n=1 Tax=Penicillium bovifimosum TaxID=126998 RepID=A0A9W9GQ30_9EURO|nr:uncharacterized protein N7515_008760 [Penicillium bovifimosum]KAJ5124935.1 hypothetical protein N7515_008760 [Penicillium bovifimosum]
MTARGHTVVNDCINLWRPRRWKTHLARHYVFTQRDCYPGGIFWIDARSRESMYKCFWEIAQAATLVEAKVCMCRYSPIPMAHGFNAHA